jgi:hypothetical protein
MSQPDISLCRWCSEAISSPRRGQKFCCDRHRYLWHQGKRISPAKLDERIRAIVREELNKVPTATGMDRANDRY